MNIDSVKVLNCLPSTKIYVVSIQLSLALPRTNIHCAFLMLTVS